MPLSFTDVFSRAGCVAGVTLVSLFTVPLLFNHIRVEVDDEDIVIRIPRSLLPVTDWSQDILNLLQHTRR